MKQFFITGTDTDCGKTIATCELLRRFQQEGQRAQALKPVASGCYKKKGVWVNQDIETLMLHNTNPTLPIHGWQFLPPISPHLAAEEEGLRLSAEDIASFCQNPLFLQFDTLLIEGSGGLLAPLNEQETWLDFLQLTKIPVILVVGMRLGCLNHALLTYSVLAANGIACYGFIANFLDNTMQKPEENQKTLVQKLPIPLLMTIPYKDNLLPYAAL